MFPCKIRVLALTAALVLVSALCTSQVACADRSTSEPSPSVPALGVSSKPVLHFIPYRRTIFALSYVSWNEAVRLTNNSVGDISRANLVGNGIILEERFLRTARVGCLLQGGVLIGVANAGGSQIAVPYRVSYQRWWGAEVSPRLLFRLAPEIDTSIGPMVLYRSLDFPLTSQTTKVESGVLLNYGLTADIRFYLQPKWQLRMEGGSLLLNASTYWALGVGYQF